MGAVTSDRIRWGALAWLLTLQFFVVETVVQFRGEGYSRADDVISDLGATTWPGHQVMNASFVVQAALILGGTVLLLPALGAGAGRVAAYLFGLAAVGVLLVGVLPSDRSGTWHGVGATMYLIGSALGLIALAYALRPRSEVLGTVLVVLGLVGTAATVFFLTEVAVLAEGATERAAAYVLPIGLAVAGLALGRSGAAAEVGDGVGAGTRDDPRPSRREERARARAAAAERARERDAALEAAAQRAAQRSGRTGTGSADAETGAGSAGAEPADDFDADDPWAPTRRTD
ncbi:DUF998 domain-containing protein [Blastococcus sp. TML/M2B]|uniref:DUF998 domain-containing protein n=1 Tax=unclassified Blastococcus TaxID=2619396 RepID=UPI001909E24D|nr:MULTISPECIES: DUF998 domain-containing protein [unclassified Blastococcus]MBN1092561.1 DUF998 domain-containing protein [Blastococcus sp. TML/M2B]MBN1097345.1 DUF998 domain-containing protein [Blastococcus sp. TML/C7B]